MGFLDFLSSIADEIEKINNEKAAKELYDYSRIEYQAIRQEETKEANRNALKPGQGMFEKRLWKKDIRWWNRMNYPD